VEVDGNLLPPNIVNKLNIFMVNVLRFRGSGDLSGLVDKAGSRNRRFTATGSVADGNGSKAVDEIAAGKIARDGVAGCAACEMAASCEVAAGSEEDCEQFEREREKAAVGK
jgi:hypothetical protein